MKNILLILISVMGFIACKDKKAISNATYKKNDIVNVEYYSSKKIKELTLMKDSLKGVEQYLAFYENGIIKEKGVQGIVENSTVNTKSSIGLWSYYDNLNRLDSTIYYGNLELGKDYIEKKRYYKNGKIKSVENYNNYILYENEIDSIGIWKSYDQSGKIIETKDFNLKKTR